MEYSYNISDVELFLNMQICGQICKLASIITLIVINFPYFSNYTRMPNSHKWSFYPHFQSVIKLR